MRVLLLSQDFPPAVGGIQRYAAELAAGLAEAGADVEVLAPGPGGHDAGLPYRVWRVPVGSDLFGLAALAWPPIQRPFDVALHAHWSSLGATWLARRRGTIRLVACAAHGRELLLEPWPRPAQRGYDALRRVLLRSADRLLPVSRFTAGLLRDLGVHPERVRVTPNGTTPERFARGDGSALRARHAPDRPLLLTVSRLVRRKGIDDVIRALARLRADGIAATYAVVGRGPDEARLHALSADLDVPVSFVGRVDADELRDWYAACDVFVMPARSEPPDVEGFGLVFLEAGAAGRAVIGARAGGVVDAVCDGDSGLLVEPGDVADLARAIAELVTDPQRAARMGRRGRELAEASRWSSIARELLLTFDDDLSRRRR